jgi:hypothetical protein
MHGSMGAGWKRGFGYRASRLPYQYLHQRDKHYVPEWDATAKKENSQLWNDMPTKALCAAARPSAVSPDSSDGPQ